MCGDVLEPRQAKARWADLCGEVEVEPGPGGMKNKHKRQQQAGCWESGNEKGTTENLCGKMWRLWKQ